MVQVLRWEIYALSRAVIAWGGGLGSLGSMLCNNLNISTIERNEGGILGRTRSGRGEGKQRKIYDIDRPDIPVFGGESGKAFAWLPPSPCTELRTYLQAYGLGVLGETEFCQRRSWPASGERDHECLLNWAGNRGEGSRDDWKRN
jgi:hypothetical protein